MCRAREPPAEHPQDLMKACLRKLNRTQGQALKVLYFTPSDMIANFGEHQTKIRNSWKSQRVDSPFAATRARGWGGGGWGAWTTAYRSNNCSREKPYMELQVLRGHLRISVDCKAINTATSSTHI